METSSSDRIAVVDVLRAFALFGIIITHASASFLVGPAPDPRFNTFSALDGAVLKLSDILTFGKFFAIFAFLFGLSFAIQLQNADRKGTAFSGRFAWRLTILLAIGFVHSLVFSGDVLTAYALLGFLLIPMRKLSSKTLVITALILVLNVPGLLLGVAQLSAPPPSPAQQQARVELEKQFAQSAQRQFEIKQSGTLQELTSVNLTQGTLNRVFFLIFSGRLWITFGLFLLGLYAGRINLFKDTDANRAFFTRLLMWSGITAAASTVVTILHPNELGPTPSLIAIAAASVQNASLAAFFVAAVTLLFWRTPRGWLAQLAPTGKMGLTTYLMQSAFGLTVFYGFGIGLGLLGKLGVAASVGLSILFFAAQILFSQW